MILFYILSQEVQCSALLLGLLFMLDEFLFFPVDVRFELAGRRQFMYPGWRRIQVVLPLPWYSKPVLIA